MICYLRSFLYLKEEVILGLLRRTITFYVLDMILFQQIPCDNIHLLYLLLKARNILILTFLASMDPQFAFHGLSFLFFALSCVFLA